MSEIRESQPFAMAWRDDGYGVKRSYPPLGISQVIFVVYSCYDTENGKRYILLVDPKFPEQNYSYPMRIYVDSYEHGMETAFAIASNAVNGLYLFDGLSDDITGSRWINPWSLPWNLPNGDKT